MSLRSAWRMRGGEWFEWAARRHGTAKARMQTRIKLRRLARQNRELGAKRAVEAAVVEFFDDLAAKVNGPMTFQKMMSQVDSWLGWSMNRSGVELRLFKVKR